MSATRPQPSRERIRSSSPSRSEGDLSAEITICRFWSTSALKVWKNSSWVESLPLMNCTSSIISRSTERNCSLKSIVDLKRSARMNWYMNFLGRQVDHLAVRGIEADVPGDGMHQVGLAEPDAAIEEQRVERHRVDRSGAAFGHPPGGGMRQLVRLADDEVLEGEARVERRRTAGHRSSAISDGTGRSVAGSAISAAGVASPRGGAAVCRIDDQRQAFDRRVLDPPQRQQPVGVMRRHPVAQKPGRRRDDDLAAVDPLDPQRPQPGAVGGLADLVLQKPQNPTQFADPRVHRIIDPAASRWFPHHSPPRYEPFLVRDIIKELSLSPPYIAVVFPSDTQYFDRHSPPVTPNVSSVRP